MCGGVQPNGGYGGWNWNADSGNGPDGQGGWAGESGASEFERHCSRGHRGRRNEGPGNQGSPGRLGNEMEEALHALWNEDCPEGTVMHEAADVIDAINRGAGAEEILDELKEFDEAMTAATEEIEDVERLNPAVADGLYALLGSQMELVAQAIGPDGASSSPGPVSSPSGPAPSEPAIEETLSERNAAKSKVNDVLGKASIALAELQEAIADGRWDDAYELLSKTQEAVGDALKAKEKGGAIAELSDLADRLDDDGVPSEVTDDLRQAVQDARERLVDIETGLATAQDEIDAHSGDGTSTVGGQDIGGWSQHEIDTFKTIIADAIGDETKAKELVNLVLSGYDGIGGGADGGEAYRQLADMLLEHGEAGQEWFVHYAEENGGVANMIEHWGDPGNDMTRAMVLAYIDPENHGRLDPAQGGMPASIWSDADKTAFIGVVADALDINQEEATELVDPILTADPDYQDLSQALLDGGAYAQRLFANTAYESADGDTGVAALIQDWPDMTESERERRADLFRNAIGAMA